MMGDSKYVADSAGTLTYILVGSSIFTIVSIVIVVGGYYGLWLGPATSDPAEIQKWRTSIVLWVIALVVGFIALMYSYYTWGKAQKLMGSYEKLEA